MQRIEGVAMPVTRIRSMAEVPSMGLSCSAAVWGTTLVLGVLPWIGLARPVQWVFPCVLTALAAFAFFRAKPLYVGMTLWVWLLTPEMRRIIDYQTGYNAINVVQVTPLLVTFISALALFEKIPLLFRPKYLGFLLILLGIVYGYLIGIVQLTVYTATFDFMQWVAPVVFGFFIASQRDNFRDHKNTIEGSFLWALLLVGGYGIYQYFYLPPWDAFWIKNTDIASIGLPLPQRVRVFSTINSPLPLGSVLMTGLLVIFVTRRPMRWPAAVIGFICFALTFVRTSWLGWVVGFIYLLLRSRSRQKFVLIGGLMVASAAVYAVLVMSPISDPFTKRLQTLSRLEEEGSYRARMAKYDEMFIKTLSNFIGNGIGSLGTATKLSNEANINVWLFDSGILAVPYELGWPGLLLVAPGLLLLFSSDRRGVRENDRPFCHVADAICISLLFQMLSFNSLSGISGLILFTFFGLRIAAQEQDATVVSRLLPVVEDM